MTAKTTIQLIDARGLKCPLPVLRAEKAVTGLKPGESLKILATDPMARIDIPHFCNSSRLDVIHTEAGGTLEFTITRPEQA